MLAKANPSDHELKQILKAAKTIAVVGLSANRARDSHRVSSYMQSAGYRIIPVNPALSEVLGEKCYPDLASIPLPVDIVNVFRRSDFVPPIAEEAAAIKAKVLWMQLGVSNAQAAATAEAAGLAVVQDSCIKVCHRRMLA